jgi:(5-formylfuran-3-yl)methyl phosphate synthase
MPSPSLLVSVRNLAEARAAIDGGCDRLDVKEPLRGPLGMADLDVIAEIAALSARSNGRRGAPPCSVALGEIDELQKVDDTIALPWGVTDIKLGPARLGTLKCWKQGWRDALGRIKSEDRGSIRHVAVAYADWQAAEAPRPDEILSAAVEFGADGFLIDTYRKDSGNLLQILRRDDLLRLATAAHQAELSLALAGSLRLEDLASLVKFHPEVIAVRGAACDGGRRSAEISSACVRQLKSAICLWFEPAGKARLHA